MEKEEFLILGAATINKVQKNWPESRSGFEKKNQSSTINHSTVEDTYLWSCYPSAVIIKPILKPDEGQ